MDKMRTIAIHILALTVSLFVLSGQAYAEEKKVESFKDWGRSCEKPEGVDKEICYIFQNLTMKDSGKKILDISIGYPPKKDKTVLSLLLPLGVALKAGVQIKVDEGKPTRFGYDVCSGAGCRAFLILEDAMVISMKKGSKAYVTFANLQGKGIAIPVSLSGFTGAFNSLR